MPSAASDALLSDGLSGKKLLMSSVSIYIGMMVANLDMAIVQNALPALSVDLRIAASNSVWIVTIYMLATLTLLLPFAPLSDRIGYRRFYLGGFFVFACASLLCGVADSFWQLLLGRLLQGVGSAAMMCSTTSLIRLVYPRKMMARAISSNATVAAISIASAPSLSALILSHLNWNWLFLINVPLGIVSIALGFKSLPHGEALPAPTDPLRRRAWIDTFRDIDWLSVCINIAFFSLLLLGTETIGERPVRGLIMLSIAALLGLLFVRRQIGDPHPMLPFDLLRERNYALTIATSFASFATQGAAFVSLPFYLQRSLGLDITDTALVLTSWPIGLALTSLFTARLMRFFSTAHLCATGQAMLAIGLGLLAGHFLPAEKPVLVAALALCGAGFALFQAPNNTIIIISAPLNRSGSVAALRAATRTAGQLIGAALTGLTFLLAQYFVNADGATLGLAIAASMAFLAAVCSLGRTPMPVSRS